MDQLGEFVVNHWELFLALAVIVALLLRSGTGGLLGPGHLRAEPLAAVSLMNQKGATVLDIRTEEEFQNGHILNAKHTSMENLQKTVAPLEKDKSRPIVVCCATGRRSVQACQQLQKSGFESVYNLEGGLAAWKNANLPVIREN